MSAAKVISQGTPQQIVSIPSWRLPVLVHLRAQITDATGGTTVVSDNDATTGWAGTTPGVSIAQTAPSSGIYVVSFDPCKAIALGSVSINILPATFATAAQWRMAVIDATAANTSAKLGLLRFQTFVTNTPVNSFPVQNSEIHLAMWLDMS